MSIVFDSGLTLLFGARFARFASGQLQECEVPDALGGGGAQRRMPANSAG